MDVLVSRVWVRGRFEAGCIRIECFVVFVSERELEGNRTEASASA